MQCPFLSASFHLHLTCCESLGSGNLTDITMDSTSKRGVLTAWFLTGFSGRKSFSTQRTSCLVVSVCDKDGEKEGRAGRGRVTEDTVSKRIKKHLFLGILIWIQSKRLQAFVWQVAETVQILPPAWVGFAGRGRSAEVSEMHHH